MYLGREIETTIAAVIELDVSRQTTQRGESSETLHTSQVLLVRMVLRGISACLGKTNESTYLLIVRIEGTLVVELLCADIAGVVSIAFDQVAVVGIPVLVPSMASLAILLGW